MAIDSDNGNTPRLIDHPEFRLDRGPDWSINPAFVRPGVTVILRTKDRPQFFRRALASIAAQAFPDLTVVIVNDGGDRSSVESLVNKSDCRAMDIELVHHDAPLGQAAALNAALARVRREFFAVHDDDDTWSPNFLSKMVQFLREPRNKRFIGAVCLTDQIIESVTPTGIKPIHQRPHVSYPPVLGLVDVLQSKIHPPTISQLMRHAALKLGGEANSALQVMYDFEWTVRVLRFADIATLPETLAFYHFRDAHLSHDDPAANSVFCYADDFDWTYELLRNKLLREELSAGRLGLGYLSSLAKMHARPALSDEIMKYLAHRARRHARWRAFCRQLERPFRFLRDRLGGKSATSPY